MLIDDCFDDWLDILGVNRKTAMVVSNYMRTHTYTTYDMLHFALDDIPDIYNDQKVISKFKSCACMCKELKLSLLETCY